MVKIYNLHEATGVAWWILKNYPQAELYIVGGAVRDFFAFGKYPEEIDFVTSLRPDELLKIFPYSDLVGKSFGVVKAGVTRGPGIPFVDVATFRKDVYSAHDLHTKGAESVEFANSLEEDLSRRDFTFNAMALKVTDHNKMVNFEFTESDLIDPYGGLNHAKNGIIRFVGKSLERIKEDPCRLLRACRFAGMWQKYADNTGGGFIEHNSLRAMQESAARVQLVAKERIHDELIKTMYTVNPALAIVKMAEIGILHYFMYPMAVCQGVMQNSHHLDDVFTHCILAMNAVDIKYPLIRMAALLHDVAKPVVKEMGTDGEHHFYQHEYLGSVISREILTNLKFSNDEINYICELVFNHMFHVDDLPDDYVEEGIYTETYIRTRTVKRIMSRCRVPIRDVLRLRMADRRGNRAKRGVPRHFKEVLRTIRKIEKENQALHVRDLKINGKDLIDMGLKPGPQFKVILDACLEHVLHEPKLNYAEHLRTFVECHFIKKGQEGSAGSM